MTSFGFFESESAVLSQCEVTVNSAVLSQCEVTVQCSNVSVGNICHVTLG